MILGTQYYRPPFPEARFWKKDLPLIKESGLNTIMLWVNWSWVEAKPGEYHFDDYDEIMDLAHANGLKVVLSTIAELQPYWIHRVVPGSEMVDNMGHKVISSNRGESNQGLTPGGCFDNPAVETRMGDFLSKVSMRYKDHPALLAWDAWNETRWEVGADGLVCYCEHTIKLFKDWLDKKYGGLTGLNAAWKRRYDSWEDVLPGKAYNRTFSEMVDWSLFFQWRQIKHLKFRYQTLKQGDPNHPITVHGPCPTMYHGNWEPEGESAKYLTGEMDHTIFHRGNDWDMAEIVDGMGTSNFPTFQKNDPMEYGGRVEMIKSAARNNKECWISELQGGLVSGDLQQVWLWTSYARGAKAVIFWNWRPEVFGREAGTSFGIIGLDGKKDSRISGFKKAGAILKKHGALLDAYQPASAKIGIFFDAPTWCIEWATTGRSDEAFQDTIGYVRGLEKAQVPYTFVESKHLDALKDLKFLIVPNAKIISPEASKEIEAFVKNGGWLLLEGEADCFVSQGFYRYPDERPFINQLGYVSLGEREGSFTDFALDFEGRKYHLTVNSKDTWYPYMVSEKTTSLARAMNGEALAVTGAYGKGRVICSGLLIGKAYYNKAYDDFESLLKAISTSAGALPEIQVETKLPLQWRFGKAGDENLLFLINSSEAQMVELVIPSISDGKLFNLAEDETLTARKEKDGWHLSMKVDGVSYTVLRWKEQG